MAIGAIEHELRIFWLDQCCAMRQKNDVWLDFLRELIVSLAASRHVFQGLAGRIACRTAPRNPGVVDEDIERGRAHECLSINFIEGITDRQQIKLAGRLEHMNFQLVTQASYFQSFPELAIKPADRREIVHAGKS